VTAAELKRLELLHELVPASNAIAYLVNLGIGTWPIQDMESEARRLGVKLAVLTASSDRDLAAAFATTKQEGVGALVVGSDPFFFMRRNQLVALSEGHNLPAIYFFRDFVAAGGLMSYGTRLAEGWHQIGVYTGKILRGANPADLPIVQQSEKIELVINLKTARALGLDVPLSMLMRVDEVIE